MDSNYLHRRQEPTDSKCFEIFGMYVQCHDAPCLAFHLLPYSALSFLTFAGVRRRRPVQVTRLIRTGYGDYSLQKIPPGMAVEVTAKPVEKQKNRGPLWPSRSKLHAQRSKRAEEENNQDRAPPVQWVRHSTESFSKRRAAMTGVSRRNFHQSARPVQNGSSRWWFLPFLVCAAILGRPTASFDWHKASAVTRRHLIHTLASGFVVGTTSCPVQALPNFLPPTENRPQISLPTAIPNNMKQPMVQGKHLNVFEG